MDNYVEMYLCFELSFLSRERNFSILEIDKLNATRSVSAELTHVSQEKIAHVVVLVVICYSLVASPIKVLIHTRTYARAPLLVFAYRE